jgi:hypothetical protein
MDWPALIRGGRLARALGMAVLLGGFLLWWKIDGDPGPVVSQRQVAGTVETVYEQALLIRLESGQTVRVYRSGDVAAGAPVQLTVTRRANGEETYVLLNDLTGLR